MSKNACVGGSSDRFIVELSLSKLFQTGTTGMKIISLQRGCG